jgi:2-dehydro-3-deoxygluconokinase
MARVVSFGEIMMRLYTPGHSRFSQATQLNIIYGGGEANMTLSLAQLGIDARHVTVFPDNDLGRAANAYFKSFGVDMAVHFAGDRLGLYFLETGAASRASRIVYDRYNSAFSHLSQNIFNWTSLLQGAEYFLFTGITPAISQSAADACLDAVIAAKKEGLLVFGDVNYRRNLWKYGKSVKEVMPALVEKCDIIVCAEGDAEDIFNIRPEAGEENTFISVSKQLMERFPNIKTIISTRRNSESASRNSLKGICFTNNNYIETPDFPIDHIVDRIGSGDAFAAGYIFGRINYKDEEKALRFATAAAVLKHTIEGDANLATVTEIETVMNGDFSAKLLR